MVERAGLRPRSHAARRSSTSSRPTRATSCSRSPTTSCSTSRSASCSCRSASSVALFVRRDPFGRFVSCLVYVPRDRYNTGRARADAAILLSEAFARHARPSSSAQRRRVAARAPALFIVRTAGRDARPSTSSALEAAGRGRRSGWSDRLARRAASAAAARRTATGCFAATARRVPGRLPGATVEPRPRVADIAAHRAAARRRRATLALSLYRRLEDAGDALRFKLYPPRTSRSLLSDVLPLLENMGLKVADRASRTRSAPRDGRADRRCTTSGCAPLEADAGRRRRACASRFEDAFAAVWRGAAENDGFNRLVLARRPRRGARSRCCAPTASTCARPASPFSQAYIEQTLAANPGIARGAGRPVRGPLRSRAGDARPRREADALAGEHRARARRGRTASTRTASCARFLDADPRDAAHQLLPARRRRRAASPTSRSSSTRARCPSLPLPRPLFEIFVYCAARRGRAPARRQGRARRHPLVRPARGLPHRDPRA